MERRARFSGTSRRNMECVSYPMYRDLRDRNPVFSGVLARWPLAFSDGYRTERVEGELVTGNYFDVLGVGAALGRTFTQDDDRIVNGHPLVILSYGFWQRRFGSDPGVLNRTVRVNGHPMTVVGVTERGFQGFEVGKTLDIMVPMMMKPQMTPTWNDLENRRSIWAYAIARLKPGVSREQAEAAMQPKQNVRNSCASARSYRAPSASEWAFCPVITKRPTHWPFGVR